MKKEETKQFILWCVLGAIGCGFMAAGDWLLGCVPLQAGDTGMFNRAHYLSGSYGLWKPVLTVGLGAIGGFLYYFVVKALNADIDEKYRKTKNVQFLCGIFTVAIALTIHTWVATMAWFATYLGPRIGAEAALAAVTTYQDAMLPAIRPLYLPMLLLFGIHFVMLLIGKTRYPRGMLAFHPVMWNLLLAAVPDIAQAMQVPVATWMSVMSQSSTNSAIAIWCIAAAVYERKHIRQVVYARKGGGIPDLLQGGFCRAAVWGCLLLPHHPLPHLFLCAKSRCFRTYAVVLRA